MNPNKESNNRSSQRIAKFYSILARFYHRACEAKEVQTVLEADKELGLSPQESTHICELLMPDLPQVLKDFGSHGRRESAANVPQIVLDAVRELLDGRQAERCLDPWAWNGQLAAFVHEETRSKKTFSWHETSGFPHALAEILAPELEHFPHQSVPPLGHPYLPPSIPDDIDVVASILPGGFSHELIHVAAAGEPVWNQGLGEALLVTSASKLSPKGRALFVVPQGFFVRGGGKKERDPVCQRFPEMGLGIDAIFDLPLGMGTPGGMGIPQTDRAKYLLVISRDPSTTTFVAALSDDLKANRRILSNFRKGVTDGPVVMGRTIETREFRSVHVSLGTLQANELIRGKAENLGMRMMQLGHLATDITLGSPFADVDQDTRNLQLTSLHRRLLTSTGLPSYAERMAIYGSAATGSATIREWELPVEGWEEEEEPVEEGFLSVDNSVFIPTRGNSEVATSVSEMTITPREHIQVVIAPDLADAEFVAHFLNSESGRSVREHHSWRRDILRMGLREITALPILVPNLKEQEEVLEVAAMIDKKLSTVSSLRADLSDLDRELWANLREMDVVKEKVLALSVSIDNDQPSEWYESLPFPLASILRAWVATAPDKHLEKQALLVDFFEATAAFFAIVLISAFRSRPGLFEEQLGKVSRALQQTPGGLERTGFGTWKAGIEILSKETHKLLEGKAGWDREEGAGLCQEIFADPSLQLPRMLASRKLDKEILPKVAAIRNTQWAHSGRKGGHNTLRANQNLERSLNDLRGLFGGLWDNVQLIRPQTCKQTSSQAENTVLLLKGSNREFLNEIFETSECLNTERLHLVTEGYHNSLELLPFIRLGEAQVSDEDTCYFFKRLDLGGGDDTAHFASYHEKDQNVIDLPPGKAGGLFELIADFKTWGAAEGLEVANDTLSDSLE